MIGSWQPSAIKSHWANRKLSSSRFVRILRESNAFLTFSHCSQYINIYIYIPKLVDSKTPSETTQLHRTWGNTHTYTNTHTQRLVLTIYHSSSILLYSFLCVSLWLLLLKYNDFSLCFQAVWVSKTNRNHFPSHSHNKMATSPYPAVSLVSFYGHLLLEWLRLSLKETEHQQLSYWTFCW